MQRKHGKRGKSRVRKRSSAWGLMLLLLIALLGVSIVNEPETDAAANSRAREYVTPVQGAGADLPYADRAYALDVGEAPEGDAPPQE